MKKLLLFLLLSWTPLFGQSQPPSAPLNEAEKRLILGQLLELKVARETIASLQVLIAREQEQDGRERASWERAIALEQQATGLAQRETALEKDRADFYESAYKMLLKKKPSFGCILKRIFTLGIHRCGG